MFVSHLAHPLPFGAFWDVDRWDARRSFPLCAEWKAFILSLTESGAQFGLEVLDNERFGQKDDVMLLFSSV